jgi:predicted metallo-beta-lactamase superfamily hydrolase
MADLKSQIDCVASNVDVNQEKVEAYRREMETKMDANQ